MRKKTLTHLTLLFAFCGTARAECWVETTNPPIVVCSSGSSGYIVTPANNEKPDWKFMKEYPKPTPIDSPDYSIDYSSVPVHQPYISREEFDAEISRLEKELFSDIELSTANVKWARKYPIQDQIRILENRIKALEKQ